MTKRKWIIIIAKVIILILSGMTESAAVAKAAALFRVNDADIWKHGGF